VGVAARTLVGTGTTAGAKEREAPVRAKASDIAIGVCALSRARCTR
jgi:hypothetical protein